MNFLRKLVLGCVTAAALLVPMAETVRAQACSGYTTTGHTRVFYVYFRTCPHDYWRNFGGYYRLADAQRVARYFQARGYEAFVR